VDPKRLVRIARRHGGLFTRAEAKCCGYSDAQIRHRLRCGDWVTVMGAVLAPAALPITTAVRDVAASLAIAGSVLAGPSAARQWRVPIDDQRTCIYVGSSGHPRLPAVTPWHSMPPADDICLFNGLRVTSRARTVVDCALLLREPQAVELLDLALVRRWVTLEMIAQQIRRRTGKRGVRRLVRLMRLVADGTRSAAERLLSELFREHKVTGWKANEPLFDDDGLIGEGDFVFRRAKLVVEADGLAFHSDPKAFGRDRERQNRILKAGWKVLRFTWYDLRYRPDYVIKSVLAEL
jgi:very-short-patch-repair endonuclease